jgi:hypothetical protein
MTMRGSTVQTWPWVNEGVFPEEMGQFEDFGVGEAAVGFADVEEVVVIADSEGIVGEDFVALAVPIFDGVGELRESARG